MTLCRSYQRVNGPAILPFTRMTEIDEENRGYRPIPKPRKSLANKTNQNGHNNNGQPMIKPILPPPLPPRAALPTSPLPQALDTDILR